MYPRDDDQQGYPYGQQGPYYGNNGQLYQGSPQSPYYNNNRGLFNGGPNRGLFSGWFDDSRPPPPAPGARVPNPQAVRPPSRPYDYQASPDRRVDPDYYRDNGMN
jgi:hypothetical protein